MNTKSSEVWPTCQYFMGSIRNADSIVEYWKGDWFNG